MINEPSILVWIQDIIVHEKQRKSLHQEKQENVQFYLIKCLREAEQVL